MELNLPAFVAHRVKKLQIKKTLIEEIHSQPEDYSRPPCGKLKQFVLKVITLVQYFSYPLAQLVAKGI